MLELLQSSSDPEITKFWLANRMSGRTNFMSDIVSEIENIQSDIMELLPKIVRCLAAILGQLSLP